MPAKSTYAVRKVPKPWIEKVPVVLRELVMAAVTESTIVFAAVWVRATLGWFALTALMIELMRAARDILSKVRHSGN